MKAAQWPGGERVDALLQAGLTHWQGIEASGNALLARTRVDFALLAQTKRRTTMQLEPRKPAQHPGSHWLNNRRFAS